LDVVLENEAKLILREINTKLKDVHLVKINDEEQGSGIDFNDEASANIIKSSLEDKFEIYAIDDPKEYGSNPREPFKTSTLQQDAINKLY
jgi:DNA topoisomerase-1